MTTDPDKDDSMDRLPGHAGRRDATTDVPEAVGDLRLVVFSDAFRHRNGVGAYYSDLLAYLEPDVAEAALICPGPAGAGQQQGLSLPLPGDPSQKLCLPGIPKARRVCRRVRPHVIVAASPGPYGLLAAVTAWRLRVPLCFGYHTQYDALTDLYWNRLFGPLAKCYLAWLDRRFFRRAAAVFTNGIHMVSAAETLGAGRIELIGTPVDTRMMIPPVPVDSQDFGPVAFVGRLAPEKNIGQVLDAARRLPDTPFVIAGDGPRAGDVRRAAAELPNLDYLGWVDRPELVELLDRRCEVLVLPSDIESFGTVAAEAMARRRLVVVSDRCGIAEWKQLAAALEVFESGRSLADVLAELAQLPAEIRAAKRRRARDACETFVRTTVADWERILLDVVRG